MCSSYSHTLVFPRTLSYSVAYTYTCEFILICMYIHLKDNIRAAAWLG